MTTVIKEVPARRGFYAYEITLIEGHVKTETRRTENHANKASAYREALLIQKEMRAEK